MSCQARRLLEAPPEDTLKGHRDRAILATRLYHGMRREELCGLRVKDIQSREGIKHFRVMGSIGLFGQRAHQRRILAARRQISYGSYTKEPEESFAPHRCLTPHEIWLFYCLWLSLLLRHCSSQLSQM
ncbi:MAG: hypothetical protein R3B95_18965 [Nitrospirales bacterium]|nr:hypothetical protein [Nitrospirales bacterium]